MKSGVVFKRKPHICRYFARRDNGWASVIHTEPGEWVWGYYTPSQGTWRPFVIAQTLPDLIEWCRR